MVKLSPLGVSLLLALSGAVHGADYPQRPIRLIVPFAAGGGLEITARSIGQKLTEKRGQSIVIDNRPGAATILGSEIAAKSSPDGYKIGRAHV